MLTHPLVVHFPIALWLVSTLFDVLAWRRPESSLRDSAYWLVGLGAAAALASIAFGWVDLLAAERQGVGTALLIRHRVHSVVAYAATAAYLANLAWRWRSHNKPGQGFLALSLVGAVLIALTGYLGGTLREVM